MEHTKDLFVFFSVLLYDATPPPLALPNLVRKYVWGEGRLDRWILDIEGATIHLTARLDHTATWAIFLKDHLSLFISLIYCPVAISMHI